MTALCSRTPCKSLFQRLDLLTLSTQYRLCLVRFLSQNLELYTFNSTIHAFNTRNKLQLHKLSTAFTIYQEGLYYGNIIMFYKLPDYISESILRKKMFYIKF